MAANRQTHIGTRVQTHLVLDVALLLIVLVQSVANTLVLLEPRNLLANTNQISLGRAGRPYADLAEHIIGPFG